MTLAPHEVTVTHSEQRKVFLAVLVAAMGYFVDIFDLQLFAVVRVPSLQALGLNPEQITTVGSQLLDWQLGGMLLGGIVWGVMGDRKGRAYALFATILLYSIGNIANAFVTTVPQYAAARFITGLGLAGEIGAGITLVSELLPPNKRGIATTIVAASGLLGSFVGALTVHWFNWQIAYIIGGALGVMLLLLRVAVHESGMFAELKKQTTVRRGHFIMLFNNRGRLLRFLGCIATALPIWFVFGMLVTFSPEFGVSLGLTAPVKASTTVMFYSVGHMLGGFACGFLSQKMRSRKKVMAVFATATFSSIAALTLLQGVAVEVFYLGVAIVAFFAGYWVVFLAMTAEQFGTNLRASATVSVPNFVRASVIINAWLLTLLRPEFGFVPSIRIIGLWVFTAVAIALWKLPETFGRDLNFVED